MDKIYKYELTSVINKNLFPQILVKTITDKQKSFIKPTKLTLAKNQIDKFYNKREWDRMKKITNPFEMIYITNKFNKKSSVSLYEPLSRSYFKMVEMIHEFLPEIIYKESINDNILNTNINPIKTFHLAEGPGGFMEAFVNLRRNKKDMYYGMTLKSINKNIPGWHKSDSFINKHNNINIVTGIDDMGDLYNIYNHYYVINRFGRESMDIITGDGGFDFSVDFNLQEEYAQKLILSQIIMGFALLRKGGTFICKFFDTFTNITKEFLFLLSIYYKKITVYKPYTSRLANSERYIICRGYKGIDTFNLYELINILDIWNILDEENRKQTSNIKNYNLKNKIKIKSILHFTENDYFLNNIYSSFIKEINIINDRFQDIQIENINRTIKLIKFTPSVKWCRENCKNQLKIAIQWCKKYGVPHKSFIYQLNYDSIYGF